MPRNIRSTRVGIGLTPLEEKRLATTTDFDRALRRDCAKRRNKKENDHENVAQTNDRRWRHRHGCWDWRDNCPGARSLPSGAGFRSRYRPTCVQRAPLLSATITGATPTMIARASTPRGATIEDPTRTRVTRIAGVT